MSLLLEGGHVAAAQYPVAVVWSESRIIRQRKANEVRMNAVAMQTVIASIFSTKGGEEFGKLLERIGDVG